MNNVVIWIVIAAVILGGGYFLISSNGSETKDAMTEEKGMIAEERMPSEGRSASLGTEEGSMMKKDDSSMEKEERAMTPKGSEPLTGQVEKGSYERYAASKLANADSGDVVLFFRASWCPTCKALDSNIRANFSAIPAGLTILDVDYDNSTELKQKYRVTYQHTFVQVRSDGSQIKKWSGSPTLAALVAEVE